MRYISNHDNYMDLNRSLVSVIIPVYNIQDYIEETLESVLRQSYKNIEILVINDASTDKTMDVVNLIAKKDSRIKILSNQRNKGVSGARNSGLMNAEGEWIAFLDGDDIWTVDSLEKRLDCLVEFPQATFISSNFSSFQNSISDVSVSAVDSNPIWKKYLGDAIRDEYPIHFHRPVLLFLETVLTWTNVALIKKEALKKSGFFDENLPTGEDDHLWLRLSLEADFVFTPYVLAYYRQRENSLTHTNNSKFDNAPLVYIKLLKDVGFLKYSSIIRKKIIYYNTKNVYFYRKNNEKIKSIFWSFKLLFWGWKEINAWKLLIASLLFLK